MLAQSASSSPLVAADSAATQAAGQTAGGTAGVQSAGEAVQLIIDKLHGWLTEFIALLPELFVALIIIAVAVLMARVVKRLVRTAMESVSNYSHVNSLVATMARLGVLIAGFLIALGVLGLDGVVTGLVAGAGVVGLALGFAFQDIAANFISGFMLAIRRPFREGDIIETEDYVGIVEEINLRTTILDSFQGQRVIIPNQDVLGNPLINYSQRGIRRVDLSCGVAYGDDLEKAKKVAMETIEGIEYRDQSKDVDLYYNEFGGSSVNFVIRFWVNFKGQTDYLGAQSDSIMRLKKAYDDAGITIPFPIRTLDFGVVGGEKLNEVLPRSMYREDGQAPGGVRAANEGEAANADDDATGASAPSGREHAPPSPS